MAFNSNKLKKSEARRRRITRNRRRRGLGPVWLCEMEMPAHEGARVLSERRVWDEDGEGYAIIRRIRLPRSIVSMHEGWKMRNARIGSFLNETGLAERTHCQHAYDCCGNFYTHGADVLSLKGRVIVIRQHYHQNL